MTIRSLWGPSGTLSLVGWQTLFTGPYVGDPIKAPPEALDGRLEFVDIDGAKALKMSVLPGDGIVAKAYRTTLAVHHYAHIIDWVKEGVKGARAEWTKCKYRLSFMVPEQDLSFLKPGNGSFFTVAGIHQSLDKNPADTYGGNTPFSIQVRPADEVRGLPLRYAVLSNRDPNPTTTADDPLLHRIELMWWPFNFGEWHDLYLDVQWSYSDLGYCHVYRNFREIFSEVGVPNCQNNSPARGGSGNYPQLCAYSGQNKTRPTTYHRGVVIGSKKDALDPDPTFEEMYADVPGAVLLTPATSGVISAARSKLQSALQGIDLLTKPSFERWATMASTESVYTKIVEAETEAAALAGKPSLVQAVAELTAALNDAKSDGDALRATLEGARKAAKDLLSALGG